MYKYYSVKNYGDFLVIDIFHRDALIRYYLYPWIKRSIVEISYISYNMFRHNCEMCPIFETS